MPHTLRRMPAPLLTAVLAAGALCASPASAAAPASSPAAGTVPRFDHVVVVMEENHSYSDIIGSSSAPYLNSLAAGGASFTRSYAIEHPSQPNYLDLFSGQNQGVTDDTCPHTFTADNLGNQLDHAGMSFAGYSEGLPADGSTACTAGSYARKHAPWTNFSDLPAASTNLTFDSFPSDYSTLPTVSWVVPNLDDDMHDGTVAAGDTWLHDNLDGYAQWATTHNSLLLVTWDEDDGSQANQIPTIFYGAHVATGTYDEKIDHFDVLRTLEDAYGLPALGASASATPITDVWTATTAHR